ncbi:hypothetical protein LC087_12720 [Bacillus carboniphilus]|uniref:Uncharacterized protein n=1 Tax=Bacillus carboniphilus TaxID=86663 RepID=A0ABY9JQN8_9BACI|nr:hypothetical protein [Bacillus carboniphilus]WLR41722.1 hypothetical protein LC087_12720 [Bacillus carboniphilus]
MINGRIIEIEQIIDNLMVDILVPLRTSKSINHDAFNKLYNILNEIILQVNGEELIRRNLVGMLYFIYISVASEADHSHSSSIFMEVAKLEDHLSRIFWDSPFKKEI